MGAIGVGGLVAAATLDWSGESFMCVYWVAVPKAMRARRANIGEAGGSYPHLSNSSTHQSFSRDDRFWDED
jgi:hypothetical protein